MGSPASSIIVVPGSLAARSNNITPRSLSTPATTAIAILISNRCLAALFKSVNFNLTVQWLASAYLGSMSHLTTVAAFVL